MGTGIPLLILHGATETHSGVSRKEAESKRNITAFLIFFSINYRGANVLSGNFWRLRSFSRSTPSSLTSYFQKFGQEGKRWHLTGLDPRLSAA